MGSSFSNSEKNFGQKFPILYRSRYCEQENFEIAAFCSDCDGKDIYIDKPVFLSNFDTKDHLTNLMTNCSPKISCKP